MLYVSCGLTYYFRPTFILFLTLRINILLKLSFFIDGVKFGEFLRNSSFAVMPSTVSLEGIQNNIAGYSKICHTSYGHWFFCRHRPCSQLQCSLQILYRYRSWIFNNIRNFQDFQHQKMYEVFIICALWHYFRCWNNNLSLDLAMLTIQ